MGVSAVPLTERPGRRRGRPRKRRVTRECAAMQTGRLGGRFGTEAVGFLRGLAKATAREAPVELRAAARRAHFHRWTGLIAGRRKVARCPELTRGGPQRLVVLAAEVEGADGATSASSSSAPCSGSTSSAPHHPCAPQQPRSGRAAGGVCCRLPCSASSALGVWSMLPLPRAPDTLPLGDVLDLLTLR